MKNNIKEKQPLRITQEVIMHIFSWTCFFFLPFIVMGQMEKSYNEYDFIRSLGHPISTACIFYINYLWFAPYILKRKSYITYFIVNILFCFAMSLLIHEWFEFWKHLAPSPHPVGHTPPPPVHHKCVVGFLCLTEMQMRDFSMYVLIAILAVMIRISKIWRDAETGRQKAELALKEAEIQNLRNQINPHFLLNTLNNIYALIAFDKDRAQSAVQDLSRLLRHLLYEDNHRFVPLLQETNFLNHYIDLMKIRLRPEVELKFDMNIPEGKQLNVAPLIFISLVENAFKHGVSPTESSFIHIRIDIDEKENILFMVENSNHPKAHNAIHEKGIGLVQIQKRLELNYPNNSYTWKRSISDDGKTYRSTLKLKNYPI